MKEVRLVFNTHFLSTSGFSMTMCQHTVRYVRQAVKKSLDWPQRATSLATKVAYLMGAHDKLCL